MLHFTLLPWLVIHIVASANGEDNPDDAVFCRWSYNYKICRNCLTLEEDCESPVAEDETCQCSNIQLWNDYQESFIGGPDCTSINSESGDEFCYVSANSSCLDKKESQSARDISDIWHKTAIYYSDEACKGAKVKDFGNNQTMNGFKVIDANVSVVLENITQPDLCMAECWRRPGVCGAWSFDGENELCSIHSIDTCCGQYDKLETNESFISGFHCPSCWSTRGSCPCSESELIQGLGKESHFQSGGSVPKSISPTLLVSYSKRSCQVPRFLWDWNPKLRRFIRRIFKIQKLDEDIPLCN